MFAHSHPFKQSAIVIISHCRRDSLLHFVMITLITPTLIFHQSVCLIKVFHSLTKILLIRIPPPPIQQQRRLCRQIIHKRLHTLSWHTLQQILQLRSKLGHSPTLGSIAHPLIKPRKRFEKLNNRIRTGKSTTLHGIGRHGLLRPCNLLRLNKRYQFLNLTLGDGGWSSGGKSETEFVTIVIHVFELEGADFHESLAVTLL
mmetsp:Transcript_1694/g.2725  ORF Transcript_1694/g.2725 Transcript_1694/m.2725 type:complete len:201 (+) Transcript_1694:863-1465(+)